MAMHWVWISRMNPSASPEKKIDYIFVNDRLRVLDCRVPNVMHSDHRPIIADLETK